MRPYLGQVSIEVSLSSGLATNLCWPVFSSLGRILRYWCMHWLH